MGSYSGIHRFHEQGTAANVNNVYAFGHPAYSLYTSTKVFSLHHRITITDDNGNIVYTSASKFISLHDRTEVYDSTGRVISKISRKLLTLHERHYITMYDGFSFELSNELFHLIKDITNIDGLGWQIRGNILGLNFEIYDAQNNIVAVVGQKMLSLHDKYCIDIYRPDMEMVIVSILVALQHMVHDRSSGGSGGGGGSNSGN